MTDAARSALTVSEAFSALGNERFEAEDATFVRNREIADIWDANHVSGMTASTPEAIDRLLERVEHEFAGFNHRQFHVDFRTPPALEARLALEGYQGSETLVMLLEGEPQGQPKRHEIRPLTDDADRQAYTGLHDLDWREYKDRIPGGSIDEKTAEALLRCRQAKSPPARHWLACVDGEPRAYLSSWGGVDGVGIVEDLFAHPDFRHRGLATALIHHGVSEARREGAGPIVIVADTKDTPKRMYAALGFRPVALKREYLKRLDG